MEMARSKNSTLVLRPFSLMVGLVTCRALTLFVLPTVYGLFRRRPRPSSREEKE